MGTHIQLFYVYTHIKMTLQSNHLKLIKHYIVWEYDDEISRLRTKNRRRKCYWTIEFKFQNLTICLLYRVALIQLSHSMDMNFQFTLNNASLLSQILVNISDLRPISCVLTKLAFLIQNFSISNDLQIFFFSSHTLIDTPYHLVSTLNVNSHEIKQAKIDQSHWMSTPAISNDIRWYQIYMESKCWSALVYAHSIQIDSMSDIS